MRSVNYGLVLGSSLLLFSGLQGTDGTLMLGSMMLAAKTGLMLSNLGIGGLMMMLLAASQQGGEGGLGTYGKKRSARSVPGKPDEEAKVDPTTEEILQTERMVRQIDSAFDSFTCIPKFVCGMNAQPPSKKTTLVNDYGHLLKLMFTPDSDDEDDDEPPKGKNGYVAGLKEGETFDDTVNDELLEEDPSLLPYVLKDVMKNQNNGEDYGGPPPEYFHGPPPQRSPLSSLKDYLPKIQAGLGTQPKDSDFDSDPFFAGFRSLKSLFAKDAEGEHLPLPILAIEEETPEKVMTRKERMEFIRRKSRELELSTDALARYRIAAEVGRKLKKKDDCAKVFKKCPYKWEEVTGVVSNIRKAITNHPMVTGKDPTKEKVIYLKTTSGVGGNQSMMSIASAAANDPGATTVLHQLDNGNLMEISMKLVPMTEVMSPPLVEDLGMKRPNRTRPNLQYPTDTRFPTRDPPMLSEEDIDASTLAFQKTNVNRTRAKSNKKPKRRPGQGKLPVLKEELFTLPPPVGEDDEFEDAFPVLLPTSKGQKKVKKPVKEEQEDEEPAEPEVDDELEDEDLDDDDDDDEEFGGERALGPTPLIRRQSPYTFSSIPPFPYIQMQRSINGGQVMGQQGQERARGVDIDQVSVSAPSPKDEHVTSV